MYKAIFSRKDITELPDYYRCVSDLLSSSKVKQLGDFKHHVGTTRLQHSLNVSYYNFLLCRRLGLDSCSAARAGLLHDLFFYDRKEHEPVEGEGGHCAGHPKIAFFDACDYFSINEKEGDMIANHMWPLSPHMPHSPEGWAIQLVDKLCAMGELFSHALRFGGVKLRRMETYSLTLLVRLTLAVVR